MLNFRYIITTTAIAFSVFCAQALSQRSGSSSSRKAEIATIERDLASTVPSGRDGDFRKMVASAVDGDQYAQAMLAKLYEVENMPSRALKWYARSADNGFGAAARRLAIIYMGGHGVPKDMDVSIRWMKRGSELDDAECQYGLAVIYMNDQYKDDRQAIYWLQKSAENGYDEAQYKLGMCYTLGELVEQDVKTGAEWLIKAADNGNENAIKILSQIFEEGNRNERKTHK